MGSNNKAAGTDARRELDPLCLFVRNLGHCTTQQDLKELFSHYGTVTSVNLIRERGSGVPRGIAFVKMSTPQEVKAAMESCPHQLNGRRIVVRPAYSRNSSKRIANPNDIGTSHQLVVHDLPQHTSKKTIQELFGQFGAITNVRIDQTVRKAFVDFSNAVSLQMAMLATPFRLKDTTVDVSLPNGCEWSRFDNPCAPTSSCNLHSPLFASANSSNNKAKTDIISTHDYTFRALISEFHSSTKSNYKEDLAPKCTYDYCCNDESQAHDICSQNSAFNDSVFKGHSWVRSNAWTDSVHNEESEYSSNSDEGLNWDPYYEEDDYFEYEYGWTYSSTNASSMKQKDLKWKKDKRHWSGCVLQ